jgi:hypothetical protein
LPLRGTMLNAQSILIGTLLDLTYFSSSGSTRTWIWRKTIDRWLGSAQDKPGARNRMSSCNSETAGWWCLKISRVWTLPAVGRAEETFVN